MKTRLLSILAVLALGAVASHAHTDQFDIYEQNGTITATYLGNPLSITVTGSQDGWTIQLPSNFSLDPLDVILGEPEKPLEHNEVLVGTQPQFLTWNSDLPSSSLNDQNLSTTMAIFDAGIETGSQRSFTLNLTDIGDGPTVGVPDTASTLPFLSLAMAGLGILRKKLNG
jgi:hypothetical protein